MQYRKHYIPLESNPELFTQLAHSLGLSTGLAFHDVLSIQDDELLALVPRPVLALILVFPTSTAYECHVAKADQSKPAYGLHSDQELVMWYQQTINNACGLYGILHALSNGDARGYVTPDSHLAQLLTTCTPLPPSERAAVLEADEQLETCYRKVAMQGDSEVPANAEDEVDFHYVCFVKSHKDGHLYELDGDRNGPVDWGPLTGEVDGDVMSERAMAVLRGFVRRVGCDLGFSLLALGPTGTTELNSPI